MERELVVWIQEQKYSLTRIDIQRQAKKISRNPDFKASRGWFFRFRKRNEEQLKKIERVGLFSKFSKI